MVLILRVEQNYVFSTHDTHSELCDAIRIAKGYRKEKWGYFLRAESFYNVATQEEEYVLHILPLNIMKITWREFSRISTEQYESKWLVSF